MDMRELKGLEIAARAKIVFDGKAWSVPSQSSPTGSYRVLLAPAVSCSCEDFALTGKPCKHVIAARLVRERDGIEDAPPIDTESVPKKPSYAQVWPAYNAAQTHEKDHFQDLLADLCAAIPEPARKGGSKGGRPPRLSGTPSSSASSFRSGTNWASTRPIGGCRPGRRTSRPGRRKSCASPARMNMPLNSAVRR